MHIGKIAFSRVMEHLPMHTFRRYVQRYRGNHKVKSFIEEQRDECGVGPICKQLLIAVSTYYEHKARQSDLDKEPDRTIRDRWLACQQVITDSSGTECPRTGFVVKEAN